MTNLNQSLSETELASFKRDGFVVIKKLASTQICDEMCAIAQSHLGQHLAPIEYEVDVQYPGAPKTVDEEGGKTTRRLLHAYSRHELFRNWSTSPQIASHLDNLFMSRHNPVTVARRFGTRIIAIGISMRKTLLASGSHWVPRLKKMDACV